MDADDVVRQLGATVARGGWSKRRQEEADRLLVDLASRAGRTTGDLFADTRAGKQVLAAQAGNTGAAILVELGKRENGYLDAAHTIDSLVHFADPSVSRAALGTLAEKGSTKETRQLAKDTLDGRPLF